MAATLPVVVPRCMQEDVVANSFNILRAHVHLYGRAAEAKLVGIAPDGHATSSMPHSHQ